MPTVAAMRTPTRTWLTIGALALVLTACSAQQSADSGAVADEAPAAAPEGAADDGEVNLGGGFDAGSSNRSIITTGDVTVSAEDPLAAADEIVTMVERMGGWLEGERLQAGSDTVDPWAQLVLRIPSREVGTALGRLADVGKVEHVSLERTDVTMTVRDLAARIRAVEMSVERMEDLLARASSADDLVRAEQMLTDRQSQLEQLLSQQAVLEDQVSMSTLTVDVVVPDDVPQAKPREQRPGFLGGLRNGWEAFLDFGAGALAVIGALLPWLVFAAVVVALALWARRLYRRVRPARPRPQVPPTAYGWPPAPGAPGAPAPEAPPAPPAPQGTQQPHAEQPHAEQPHTEQPHTEPPA